MSALRSMLIDTGRLVPRAARRPALYDARPYLAQDDWGLRLAAWDMRDGGYPVPEEWRRFLDAIDS